MVAWLRGVLPVRWPVWTSTYKATSYSWHLIYILSVFSIQCELAPVQAPPWRLIPSELLIAPKLQSSLSPRHFTFQRHQAQHSFLELESSLDYHDILHTQSLSSYLIDFLLVCYLFSPSKCWHASGLCLEVPYRFYFSYFYSLALKQIYDPLAFFPLEVGSRFHSLEFELNTRIC